LAIKMKEVDAVIVGVGWSGGILAAELTKAGMNVVGLERGMARDTETWLDRDELKYAVRHSMMQNVAQETWTLRHNLQENALPWRQLGAFLPGTGLGGSGVHWNGQCWRYHPWDFTEYSSVVERYGKKMIPEGMTIQDWGITYEEMEPYYNTFEYMAGISGKAGNLNGKIIAGGNPFEGPRSHEYPTPPMARSRTIALMEDISNKFGYHPFRGPSANLSTPYTNPDGVGRGPCVYCGFCERFGCEVGAKASAVVTVIPVALKTGKFDLRTNSYVFRINHDGQKATGVSYYDPTGREVEQPAGIVIVTSYVFNNNRLLLLSNMGRPYDPATGEGVVGKNYAYNSGGAGGTAYFDDRDFDPFMGAGALSEVIDDFNADNFNHEGLGFIGGASVSAGNSGARPIQTLPVPPNTPAWGAQWKAAIRQYHNSTFSIGAQGTVAGYRDVFLDLDPNYTDQWGLPIIRMTFNWQENERKMIAYLGEKIAPMVKAAGAKIYTGGPGVVPEYFDPAVYQSTHNTGGTIMGADPATSVVNNYLQMWDFDNVWVVGASNFPQQAGFNPTGTVGALAYRAADGIINHYSKNPGPLV
jgi:gluconate 2-dehydrogenase alpha chain